MTDEQIAKLYDQALVIENNGDYVAGELDPVKFAKLVAEHERKWVGLTDDDIEEMWHLIDWESYWSYGKFARVIEAKLKEKNT